VEEIRLKGWRPTSDKIQELGTSITAAKAKVPKECTTCLIYNLFDSCLYFTRCEDGSLIPPKRGSDGIYHVTGESVLAPREMQARTFKQLLPVLQPDESCLKILLAPLPRYMAAGCCPRQDHVSNRRLDTYKKEAEAEVYACKGHLKDLSYTHGLRNTRVVSTWHLVKNLQDVWSKDNIHLASEGYTAIAEAVLDARASLGTRKRGGSGPVDTPPEKRPRFDQRDSGRQRSGNLGSHQMWRSDGPCRDARTGGHNYPRDHHSGTRGGYYSRGGMGGWGRGRRGWN